MRLTRNLSRYEFECSCGCGFDTVDFELVVALQEAADHFAVTDRINVMVLITGGNRCITHNESVQLQHNPNYVVHSSKSQHVTGNAADFKLFNRKTNEQVCPVRVASYLESKCKGRFGIGRYHNRTHFDTRSNGPARWSVV